VRVRYEFLSSNETYRKRLEEMKKSKEALRIFELNAQENPSSYTYDSLGEACTEAGDKECAIKSFKKSLLLSQTI
jgi:tetratricopeptide (TPR) repeat protein